MSERDYERIARAIRLLHERQADPPPLGEVARAVGLSEFHFQRLFSRWAGISPKRFVQFLSKERALAALRESDSLLEATLEAGLSSPGRLHDLMVRCEAMTPGEIRSGGAGLRIRHGMADTPFGPALIGWTGRGVCYLAFCDEAPEDPAAELLHLWPNAVPEPDPAGAAQLAQQIFCRLPDRKPLPVLLSGTNFQLRVWQALLQVGTGALVSYRQLAALAGSPRASRAVGSAMAANHIAFLIPCHRVIRETGDPGNYRWGLERKLLIQGWEAARREG